MRAAVKVLMDAVAERGLSFKLDNGKAKLLGNPKEVTPELLAALKFFRGEILEAQGIKEDVEETPKEEPPPEPPPAKKQPIVPDGATIVVADKDARTDQEMITAPYMWCWFLGEQCSDTWYYIADYPVPKDGV